MTHALHDELRALHAELAVTETLDDESRMLLVELSSDIRRLVDAGERPQLKGKIENVARRFEATHPFLASLLQQLGESLARAGI